MTCYIACEENLLHRVQNYVHKSQRAVNFLGNTALLPSDVIDFLQCCPLRVWCKHFVHCNDVM